MDCFQQLFLSFQLIYTRQDLFACDQTHFPCSQYLVAAAGWQGQTCDRLERTQYHILPQHTSAAINMWQEDNDWSLKRTFLHGSKSVRCKCFRDHRNEIFVPQERILAVRVLSLSPQPLAVTKFFALYNWYSLGILDPGYTPRST